MKKNRLYGVTLMILGILTACTTSTQTENFPTDTNTTENCAADGVGCKQFNENLRS